MDTIFTFLATLQLSQIIILTIIWAIIYILITKLFESDLSDDLSKIKESKNDELNQYIFGEMSIIESQSTSKAKELLKDYPEEYIKYCLVLERNLYFDVMEHIKQLLKINHFHHKTGPDLEEYIKDKSEVLLCG